MLDLLASAGLAVGGHLDRPGLTEDDLAWLAARATYDGPRGQATGADLVLVNGAIAWQHGQPVTARPAGQMIG